MLSNLHYDLTSFLVLSGALKSGFSFGLPPSDFIQAKWVIGKMRRPSSNPNRYVIMLLDSRFNLTLPWYSVARSNPLLLLPPSNHPIQAKWLVSETRGII